jgi:hypothetical protein
MKIELNCFMFAGGSNFQIGWSNDKQNDEQVPPRGSSACRHFHRCGQNLKMRESENSELRQRNAILRKAEVTLARWSRFNVSFLADFPLGAEEIGYEEEAFFDRANCGCPESG